MPATRPWQRRAVISQIIPDAISRMGEEASATDIAAVVQPNFVEVARILSARCGLADRVEIREADAITLQFQDGTFDHVWSYAVTMNIADKEGLALRGGASAETGRALLV
jgi:hypothetical protein